MVDQPVREGSTRQLPMDWPKDFHPWDPSIRPGRSDQDKIALPEGDEVTAPFPTGDQLLPGPSTGPIPAKDMSSSAHQKQGQPGHTRGGGDKSANKKQSALVFTEGERDRLTPLISTNTQKHTTPALTRGYKTGEKGQQKSVSRQEPEGQHPRQGKTTDPKPVREQCKWVRGSFIPTTPMSTRQTQTRVTSPSEGTRVRKGQPTFKSPQAIPIDSPKRTRVRKGQTTFKGSQVSPMDEVPPWAPSWRRERREGQGGGWREWKPNPGEEGRGRT